MPNHLGHEELQQDRFDAADAGYNALSQVLEMLHHGVVLLGRHRRVVYLNGAANQLISQSSTLTRAGRTLRAFPEALEHWLGTCMRVIEAPDRAGIAPISDTFHTQDKNERISLLARRVSMADGRQDLLCLYLSALHQDVKDAAHNMGDMFNFSARESTVVAHLLEGHSVPEIAREMGVKTSTVQTYVKRIHQKTGLSRQSEIVSLGLSLNIGVL